MAHKHREERLSVENSRLYLSVFLLLNYTIDIPRWLHLLPELAAAMAQIHFVRDNAEQH